LNKAKSLFDSKNRQEKLINA